MLLFLLQTEHFIAIILYKGVDSVLFNRAKKVAKMVSWQNLRASQKLVVQSKMCNDLRINPGKMIAVIGACSCVYYEKSIGPEISTAEKSDFLNYLFKFADSDLYSLLKEYRLPTLPDGFFKSVFIECETEYDNSKNAGGDEDDCIVDSYYSSLIHALNDPFKDEYNFERVLEKHNDELIEILKRIG